MRVHIPFDRLSFVQRLREAAADYTLVESGMAGPPDGLRHSLKNGQTWLAVAGPEGERTELIVLNPFQTRKEHMIHFSRHALSLLRKVVEGGNGFAPTPG